MKITDRIEIDPRVCNGKQRPAARGAPAGSQSVGRNQPDVPRPSHIDGKEYGNSSRRRPQSDERGRNK